MVKPWIIWHLAELWQPPVPRRCRVLLAVACPEPGWTRRGPERCCDPPAHPQFLGWVLAKGVKGLAWGWRDSHRGRFAWLLGFFSRSHCSQKPSGCHCCPLQGDWKPTSSSFAQASVWVPPGCCQTTRLLSCSQLGSPKPLPHQHHPSPVGHGREPGLASLPTQACLASGTLHSPPCAVLGPGGGEEEVGCPACRSSPTAVESPE